MQHSKKSWQIELHIFICTILSYCNTASSSFHFFFQHQWAKWMYYTVAEEVKVVQSNILFYFTESKDVKKIQLTLIWELCPKKLFPTLQNGKTKRSNNSEIPVCKRDFSTSGAMATDQFIMPATPTNKKQKQCCHVTK